MIETLYVNGCSWTLGNEIDQSEEFGRLVEDANLTCDPDCVNNANWALYNSTGEMAGRHEDFYNKLNWAGHLKDHLNAKHLVNDAFGGGSNQRIVRTTLDYIKSLSRKDYAKTLIVIGWTNCGRDEIYFNKAWQKLNNRQPFSHTFDYEQDSLSDAEKKKLDKIHDQYIAGLFDEHTKIKYYFDSSYMLSNTLKNLGIAHLFFNAIPVWFDADHQIGSSPWSIHFKDINLQNKNKNFLNIEDSFNIHVFDKKLPTGQWGHPAPTAHQSWARYIHNKIIKSKII